MTIKEFKYKANENGSVAVEWCYDELKTIRAGLEYALSDIETDLAEGKVDNKYADLARRIKNRLCDMELLISLLEGGNLTVPRLNAMVGLLPERILAHRMNQPCVEENRK